jgi:hypothetical protein
MGLTHLDSLALGDADGLTVNDVIVPQTLTVTYRLKASPATEAFFIADAAYQVTAIREVHSTAGSDATPPTISVSKDTGTAAPGAGTGLLTAALSLHATANTVQTGSLSATKSDLQMAAGDRLSVVLTGTLTALAGVVVTVSLKRI